jgi:uncharacterized protein
VSPNGRVALPTVRLPSLPQLIRLVIGLVASAIGTVLSLRAAIGVAPWDVFHSGLSHATSLSFGQAVIVTGLVLIVVSWVLGIAPGIGTVLNMVLIGVLDDALLNTGIGASLGHGPVALRVGVLLAALVFIGFGAATYISAHLGAGPRDSFQLALSKSLRLPAGVARTFIEVATVGGGWLLGGQVNWGTAVAVAFIGPIVQFAFKVLHLDRTGARVATAQDGPPQR